MIDPVRRVVCMIVVCAGCLDAPNGGGGDGGAMGGDGGAIGEVVSQLDLGVGTVHAARSRTSGDVFVTGTFTGDSPLQGVGSAEGVGDLYVVSVSGADGALRYARQYGGEGAETPLAIAVDPMTEEVVVTGLYDGDGSAGGDPLGAPPSDASNLFVAGYDAEGAHRWSHAGSGPGGITPSGGLSLGGGGEALVCGFFDGHISFGDNSVDTIVPYDIFYVPVSAAGEVGTLVQHGSESSESCTDAVAAGDGPVYLLGAFQNGFSISGTVIESSGGGFDGFVASVNPAGDDAEWAIVLSGAGDFGAALGAIRPDGGLILFGWFAGDLTFPLGVTLESESVDMFVAAIEPDGDVEWARKLGGPGTDFPMSVSVTDDGHILISGTFFEEATFGEQELVGQGELEGFAAMIDPDGEVAWVRAFGGPLDDTGSALVEGEDGTVFAGVQFRGVIDFGGAEPIGAPDDEPHAALIQLRP